MNRWDFEQKVKRLIRASVIAATATHCDGNAARIVAEQQREIGNRVWEDLSEFFAVHEKRVRK